eukprot:COSAG06_NODE_22721_length_714_cov_74.510569_1_plen_185_part_10
MASGVPLQVQHVTDTLLGALPADHAAELLRKLAPGVESDFMGRLDAAVQSKPPSALEISMLAPAVMDATTSQRQDDLCAKILSASAEMPDAWSSSSRDDDDNDKGTEESLRRLCLAFPEGATFDAEAAGSVGVDSKLSKAEAVVAGEELLRSLKRRRVLETVSDGRHRIVTWVADMAKRADADSE